MAQIMLNGVNSLEWLGRRIRDSHPVPKPILCGWRGMQVGDVALVVVLDLFKDPDGQSTAHELDWDTFLERSSPSQTPEQVLRGLSVNIGAVAWKKNGTRSGRNTVTRSSGTSRAVAIACNRDIHGSAVRCSTISSNVPVIIPPTYESHLLPSPAACIISLSQRIPCFRSASKGR
jgi:hypothetical protein